MKSYPKIDVLGEVIKTRAYGEPPSAKLRIGDQHETGSYSVRCCPNCASKGEECDWSPAWSGEKGVHKSFKYEKGFGFGLKLEREECPECVRKNQSINQTKPTL